MKGFELFYSGVVRHLGQMQRFNRDKSKQWVEHILTMEHQSPSGSPVLTTFKLSKAAIKGGCIDKLMQMMGQEVRFSSFVQNRVYNGKVYEDFYFTGF